MGDAAEYKTSFNLSNVQPLIHGSLSPPRHRNCAHMTTFTEQVNDGPVTMGSYREPRF
jgi:hypothetical protein